jgi:hypothetical protein
LTTGPRRRPHYSVVAARTLIRRNPGDRRASSCSGHDARRPFARLRVERRFTRDGSVRVTNPWLRRNLPSTRLRRKLATGREVFRLERRGEIGGAVVCPQASPCVEDNGHPRATRQAISTAITLRKAGGLQAGAAVCRRAAARCRRNKVGALSPSGVPCRPTSERGRDAAPPCGRGSR